METKYSNLRKGFIAFHISSAVLTTLAILFFIQLEKFPGIYKISFIAYILSGWAILALFSKTLNPFQKSYFEFIFVIPLLIAAFLILVKIFEYLMFS